MPIDTKSAYADLINSTDELLAKTASRVAASPLAAVDSSKTAERIAILDEAVAETAADAQDALEKLASLQRSKIAARAEKVEIVRHIARTASALLER